MYSVATHCTIT